MPDPKYSKELYTATGIEEFNTQDESIAPGPTTVPKLQGDKNAWLERAYAQLDAWMQTNSIDWKTLGEKLGAPRPTTWGWSKGRCRPSPKYFQSLHVLTRIAEFQPPPGERGDTMINNGYTGIVSVDAAPDQSAGATFSVLDEQPTPPTPAPRDQTNSEALVRLASSLSFICEKD